MSNKQLEIRNVRVVNTRDTDVVLRDCYGVEHVLFPKGEQSMPVLTEREKPHDYKRTGCSR